VRVACVIVYDELSNYAAYNFIKNHIKVIVNIQFNSTK